MKKDKNKIKEILKKKKMEEIMKSARSFGSRKYFAINEALKLIQYEEKR